MNQAERDEKLAEVAVNIGYFKEHIPQMLQDILTLAKKTAANETLLTSNTQEVHALAEKFQGHIADVSALRTSLDNINQTVKALDKELDDLWEANSDLKQTIAELKMYHSPHIHKEGKKFIDKVKEFQFFAGVGAAIVAILWGIFKVYSQIGQHIPGLPGF